MGQKIEWARLAPTIPCIAKCGPDRLAAATRLGERGNVIYDVLAIYYSLTELCQQPMIWGVFSLRSQRHSLGGRGRR